MGILSRGRIIGRSIILNFMRTGRLVVERTRSVVETVTIITQRTVGYLKTEILSDIRYFDDVLTKTGTYDAYDRKRLLSSDTTIKTGMPRAEKYDYVFQSTSLDPFTNKYRFVTIRTSNRLTIEELEEQAAQLYNYNELYGYARYDGFKLVQVKEYEDIR